jgi:hypothetical protein
MNSQIVTAGRPQAPPEVESIMVVHADHSASLDDNKLYLTFCMHVCCNYFGHGWQDCYCCGNRDRPADCHEMMDECKAKSPSALCATLNVSGPQTLRSIADMPMRAASTQLWLRYVIVKI